MTLAQAGLCFDVMGAAVLGWTFLVFNPEKVVLKTISPPGSVLNTKSLTNAGLKAMMNPERVETAVSQRADGFAGTALLVAGFALQLVGSYWQVNQDWILILPPAGLLAIGIYGKWLRQRWIGFMWSQVTTASS